jgi:hypothetical protein
MAVVIVRRSVATNVEGMTASEDQASAGSGEGSKTGAEWPYGLLALALVAVYWFLFVSQQVLGDLTPAPAVQLVEGIAAFALFYVAAQAIERLLEPIVSMDPIKRAKAKTRDDKTAAAAAGGDAGEAAAAQGALDQWRANRAAVIWALATILGMIASAKLGLYFVSALVEVDPDVKLDVLITGLAIGGGSKPLHDLITNVQVKSNNASDAPSET